VSARRSELELYRAIAGAANPADLAEFADRLRRCAHWVLRRMTAGHTVAGEADDIVSDALFRLEQLRERGFSGGEREFRSYLYRVVVSACVEAMNRRRWTVSLDAPVTLPDGEEKPLGDVLRGMVDPLLGPDATLAEAEEGRRVRQALERLDARCRELLRRFHMEGVPIKELAPGTRLNTVEVALTRCRQRLYAAFLSLYVESGDAGWRQRVGEAAARLSGELAKAFRAWWLENRSVANIGRELGLGPAETKALLGRAKLEVWRLLSEQRSSQ
jgi:RNA polymerase sigma factor (sigma-70 family)